MKLDSKNIETSTDPRWCPCKNGGCQFSCMKKCTGCLGSCEGGCKGKVLIQP